jgi:DNA-binding transcriptional ArsR family regulator
MKPFKTHYDIKFLEQATETLRAIAHPIRFLIIDMLFKNERMSVTEIYEALDIDQAVASHHLRILKTCDVLDVERDGKNSYYSLTNTQYYQIVDILTKTI